MKVGALQSDIVWEDPAANFARLRPWVEVAAASDVRLLALPEMFACGFSMATDRIAEPAGGPSHDFLVEQSTKHGLWIAGSVPERPREGSRPYNTLLLASPQGEVTRYRKIHPFSHAGEHEHYDAGASPVSVVVEGVRISLFICYDLRFADEFWAVAAETDAYLVVANWPRARRDHWQALLAARAIENQAYVIGVNRVGSGGLLDYSGDSRIIDPSGALLASAAEQETLITAEITPELVGETRAALPFLKDRRTLQAQSNAPSD
jgi:predicted amidohydrolase